MITFERLKRASFTHSVIYLTLLVVWIVPGLHPLEFVFGLAHGVGWIAMSIACLYASLSLRAPSVLRGVPVRGPAQDHHDADRGGRRRDRRDRAVRRLV